MAHFSNSTDHEFYEQRFCYKCLNYKEDECGESCLIMVMHFLNAGDDEVQPLLDFFIPRKEDGENDACKMFLGKPAHLDVDWRKIQEELFKEVG